MAWCAHRRCRSSIVPLYCSQFRVSRRYLPYPEPGGAPCPSRNSSRRVGWPGPTGLIATTTSRRRGLTCLRSVRRAPATPATPLRPLTPLFTLAPTATLVTSAALARTGSPIRFRTNRCRSGASGMGPRTTGRPPRRAAPASPAGGRCGPRRAGGGGGITWAAARSSWAGPASVTPGAVTTTFQPAELRQVPNACRVVPPATVTRYLPDAPKVASPLPVYGSAGSACNWTVDKPPLYRLMQVSMNAYAPNGLASGNGSATRAATDAYSQALQELQVPPKHSPSARATVQVLSGFGSQAYSALQVFHVGGAVTDVATVMVRYHNVIVTVKLNGTEHSNKGNYGPVSKPQLAAAAMAFARAAEASLH